ncbi:MAG: hypothetical protein LBQ54_06235 [Planctomycetaceae bacterium]|jgi:hypothetical protein|nr:hypothetical protein [Planctomycetaceae bacterium]
MKHSKISEYVITWAIVVTCWSLSTYAQSISSRTTVAPFYTPPATSGLPAIPVTDPAFAQPIFQTQMFQGTPGAVTVPSTGMIISQFSNTVGNIVSQTGIPNTLPLTTVPRTYLRPEIDYEWTYSRIKNVGYYVVKIIDPRTGSVTTAYRPEEVESLLPWLHQKEVVRYKPVTVNVAVPATYPVIPSSSVTPMVLPPVTQNIPTAYAVPAFPGSTVIDPADKIPTLSQSISYPTSSDTMQYPNINQTKTVQSISASAMILPAASQATNTQVTVSYPASESATKYPQQISSESVIPPSSIMPPTKAPQARQNVLQEKTVPNQKESLAARENSQPSLSTEPSVQKRVTSRRGLTPPKLLEYKTPLSRDSEKTTISPKWF